MGKQENVVGSDFLGNRRPNILTSTPAAPGALFAGVEGGLVRLTAAGPSWIYQSNQADDPNTHGYVYVRTVFIDPCISGHMSFGGNLNAANPILQFYESTDDGAHSTRQDAPGSLRFSDINVVGTPSSDGRDLILAATLDHTSAHVLVREY